MSEWIHANWPLVAVAIVVLLIAVVVISRRAAKPAPRRETSDVLSEGAARASRNTALIDAPSAASFNTSLPPLTPLPASEALGGIGEAVAAAASAELRAAEPESEPQSEPEPQSELPATPVAPAEVTIEPPVVAATASADDLLRIKGVGPKLAKLLADMGVTRFDEIAGWTDADLDRLDGSLGAFAGRPRRDGWVEQARLLAAGDTAGFEGKFGKL